jgi:hypothetical protein
MGRVREYIKAKGKKFWTLFDTGARNTYVVPRVAAQLVTSELHAPFRAALGGDIKESRQSAILEATLDGYRVSTLAMVIDRIGKDEAGKPIDILFGALAMQNWGIRPIPDEKRLDLSHYPDEFVEYCEAVH